MDSVCSEFQGKLNILAHMALHDIDAAVESFKNALVLEPNDDKFICFVACDLYDYHCDLLLIQRRRDRINEKMRALQDLIPNCNKVRLFILSNLEPYLLLLEPKMQPEKQRNETKRQEAWQVYGALLCAVGQCMHEKAKIFSNLLSPTRASSRPKAMIAMSRDVPTNLCNR
ncbi:hypothetical protein Ahy_A06g029111 isoform B [Arachis hypogaea]|uniref:Uncharacterized protein n=1 Tax=Arachis hypogaea TaxID=3818 RepID=A0A445CSG1_ARAHY|nr:hypothetical protein Ahy_A06g029111 isoform B [Arachis hypogaea]